MDLLSAIPHAEPCGLNAILRPARRQDLGDLRDAPAEGQFFPGKWVLNNRLSWDNFPTFNWMDLYGSILPPHQTQSRYRQSASVYKPIVDVAPDLLAIEDAPMSLPGAGGETRAQFWSHAASPAQVTMPEGRVRCGARYLEGQTSHSMPSRGWVHLPEGVSQGPRSGGQGSAAAPVSISSDGSDD